MFNFSRRSGVSVNRYYIITISTASFGSVQSFVILNKLCQRYSERFTDEFKLNDVNATLTRLDFAYERLMDFQLFRQFDLSYSGALSRLTKEFEKSFLARAEDGFRHSGTKK